jgi:hypothetical protein
VPIFYSRCYCLLDRQVPSAFALIDSDSAVFNASPANVISQTKQVALYYSTQRPYFLLSFEAQDDVALIFGESILRMITSRPSVQKGNLTFATYTLRSSQVVLNLVSIAKCGSTDEVLNLPADCQATLDSVHLPTPMQRLHSKNEGRYHLGESQYTSWAVCYFCYGPSLTTSHHHVVYVHADIILPYAPRHTQ